MIHALMLSLALTGCVEDVSKDKVQAQVGEAQKVEAAPEGATTLKVDPSRSTIKALGAKITATHPITFKDFDGQLTVADGKLSGVRYVVQMETLESDNERLTGHLKNEDFFDVPNHPTSSFESTKITDTGEGQVEIQGNMTIRGKTKSITFPAKVSMGAEAVEAQAEFALDRNDFGVVYPGKPDDLVQDKVLMTIELVAPR